MSCNFPVIAYRDKKGRNPKTGKWPLVSNPSQGFSDQPVIRPCGKCIGCRLDYSRQKAIRAMHEADQHQHNSFITLTYDDHNLYYSKDAIAPTLVKDHLQKFWKRLRKQINPIKIRYMACGEYGDDTERPHYHAIVFGYDWSHDAKHWKENLYNSHSLSQLWPYGHAVIGAVEFDSAAYVASYTVKKLNGEMGKQAYDDQNRIPPFGAMSLKPAIGRDWIKRYSHDVYNHDAVNVRGHLQKPPRYYDKFFEDHGGDLNSILRSRREIAEKRLEKNIIASGAVREIVTKAKISKKSQKI